MKRDSRVKKIWAGLDVLRFPTPVERPFRTHCPNCSLPLSLLQPDIDSPDRLLGVCKRCEHWFLIHLIADQTEGLLCQLPDFKVIRELSFDDPSVGAPPIRTDRDA
jgi:hypothetical protein